MEEIICVLDKSGSMDRVRDDAIGGFNAFIEDQKKIADANLTVVWFDYGFEIGYEGKLSNHKKINEWPFGGSTALLDAIGKTFKHVKERFTEEKPEKVIMAILTDGFENSSEEFTNEAVASLIKEHQEKYGWEVIFLAADQDAWKTAKGLNIKKINTHSYDSADTKGGFAAYSSRVASCRIE